MADTAPHSRLPIFKAGTHVALDGRTLAFSAADVAQIAANYDPDASEAPLVVGHPDTNTPAYGWTKGLSVEDGTLYAHAHQVDPAFAQMVNAGRFKKISASIYLPDSAGNPKPGQFYLKHVGFLGAAAPAVKGLKSASFAANDGAATMDFALPDAAPGASLAHHVGHLFRRLKRHLARTTSAQTADQVLPSSHLLMLQNLSADNDLDASDNTDDTKPDADDAPAALAAPTASAPEIAMTDPKSAADFAAAQAKLATDTAALAQREQALAEREAKAQREDAVAFAEQLVADGKLLPRQRAPVVEILLSLPAAPVSFAESGATVSKAPAEALRAFLSELPKQVDFAEKSGDAGSAAPTNFAAPPQTTVDAARMDLHARATAYAAANKVSFAQAVAALGG